MAGCVWRSERNVKKNAEVYRIMLKQESRAHIRKITEILKKSHENRTEDEHLLLTQSEDVVERVRKRTHLKELAKQRHLEIEDDVRELQAKCRQLANAIRSARHLIVYTGAGISTAASIPDYRGPNGVWTMLRQGKLIRTKDLSEAEPTYTHMSLTELYRNGYVKRIVSQNCDGLHMRSGLPTSALSELHGNMYIEICKQCRPQRQYVRLCDITERTAMRKHKTGRRCPKCRAELYDTIVHFGEKGGYNAPYNWKRAARAAEHADMILCLGSSLKVLKKYPCLWGMHKPASKRPRLYIVNLQWTPKDDIAALKINGKCDDVLRLVMDCLALEVPPYTRELDPIFMLATAFRKPELKTVTKKILVPPTTYDRTKVDELLRQSIESARNSRVGSHAVEISTNFSSVEFGSFFKDDCSENSESPPCREGMEIEPVEHNIPLSFEESTDITKVCQTDTSNTSCERYEQHFDGVPFSNADSQYRFSAPHVDLYPPGMPPWYANRVRLANIGVPHLTLGGTLLVPAKTSSDFWWNAIDSQTWLMGLQNYLFLHSLSDLGLCLQLSRAGSNLLTPSAVYGGGSSRVLTDPWRIPANRHVQQPLPYPDTLQPNIHFVPPSYSSDATQQDNFGSNEIFSSNLQPVCRPHYDLSFKHESISVPPAHGVIDLVNFMHNYCLPPSHVAVSVPPVEYNIQTVEDRKQSVDGCVLANRTSSLVSNRSSTTYQAGELSKATNSPIVGTEITNRQFVPKLNLCLATATASSAVSTQACYSEQCESDSDSAVVVNTGFSSTMSTSSPSSTRTENWFDDCSSSRSSPNIDNVFSSNNVLNAKKINEHQNSVIASTPDASPDSELTTPGWFGKGVGLRRTKKRRFRRESRESH